jgi:VanZ family protein
MLAVLWYILIWVLSSMPSDSLPPVGELGLDKIAHLTVYLVLALLVNQCIRSNGISPAKASVLYMGLLVSAGLEEWHQVFIQGRSVSIYDFLANAMGLCIGYALLRYIFHSGKGVQS